MLWFVAIGCFVAGWLVGRFVQGALTLPRSDMVHKYGYWYGWQIEFGWWLSKRSGSLWEILSKDRASYWLDWLPAWGQQRYYNALNRAMARKEQPS